MSDRRSEDCPGDKRRYIFFQDPDVVAQRAEDNATTLHHHHHQKEPQAAQVQAYPFTFISAVKRKLSLSAQNASQHLKIPLDPVILPPEMDFVKPLKVPDLKILPKSLDYSPHRQKFPHPQKDPPKPEKSPKVSLAHRKLDFSGSDSFTNDDFESLKAPDISFPSNLSKKSYPRDSSREKENRSKKTRKEDSSFSKGEDSDASRRRNLRHISRKDLEEIVQKSKTERFSLAPELLNPRKSQKKAPSSKKDSRYPGKSRERSSEGRARAPESIPKARESSRGSGSESSLQKHPEDSKHRVSSKEVKKLLEKPKRSSPKSSRHSELSEELDAEKVKRRKEGERSLTDSGGEVFLDPRRISFRDDSYQQEEFVNLVTPELNLNHKHRPRREGRPQAKEDEEGNSPLEGNPGDRDVLVHPTALHMQFQAELHLFDSYNESLRQVMDVENSLYSVKQEKEREARRCLLGGEQLKEADEVSSHVEVPEERPQDLEEPKKPAREVQTQTVNDIATQTETDPSKTYPGITYNRGSLCDLNIDSLNDLEKLEVSLPSQIRAMSEISLHETTSSIKTETGTEISISTRDVTCSFNKYLDHEMAQLIKDEKLMYDKIEMLFKYREKTLNDRTRKIVKLEEQKRALRDTGQDSRISSVKKKQRALLLKLQQEKEEMNRLKELHKLASQERKLMLQKQRNMFNPQMSTKTFLTKLKRSADCQSPRRLSGPMKGYDIRSNSSVSSLVDSDKSQLERSRQSLEKSDHVPSKLIQDSSYSSQVESPKKYEVKTRKFEEKMPRGDLLRMKAQQLEIDEGLGRNAGTPGDGEDKTESDTLVEDLSKKNPDGEKSCRRGKVEDKARKVLGSPEGKGFKKKGAKTVKKSGFDNDAGKYMKKAREDSSTEGDGKVDLDDSQTSLQALLKHSKAVKEKNHRLMRDIADEDAQAMSVVKEGEGHEEVQGLGNISTRSHVSTFTISRHSSGDSEKSYSRSVVIRSQDHRFKGPKKLAQILNAREAALATRRNCVEDWIAWHARLKAEESRVARMEEAAYKLVSATTNALCNDTTISSDTSDVEGRVELLAEKLTERRAEMAKLRKEARRQAKQRLKALEANLLNQIKKYDTTIHEMRKKLESKRLPPKENGKLAIEARNLLDFKVPEIPIKRIQEIYRNSDLLHSRSESDLITGTRSQSDSPQELVKPLSRSIESVLEDARSHSRRSTPRGSQLNSSEERISEIFEADSPPKSHTSSSNSKKSSEEIKTASEASIFSHKMDLLQLNNKTDLDEDISALENDLRTLSEMMSMFTRKSVEKKSFQTPGSGKNTSRDISEDLTRSENIDTELESIPEAKSPSKASPEVLKTSEVSPKTSPRTSSTIPEKESIKSPGKSDVDEGTVNDVDSVISEHLKTTGNILEISGAALERSMETLHKENEALSSDFTSLEGDIKSISEMISKMSESKSFLGLPEGPVDAPGVEIPGDDVEEAVFQVKNSETNVLEASVPVESSGRSSGSSPGEQADRDDGNESSLVSEKSVEVRNSSERDGLSLDKSDWTVSDSFEVPKVSLLEDDGGQSEEEDEDDDGVDDDADADDDDDDDEVPETTFVDERVSYQEPEESIFLPGCESTKIHGRDDNDHPGVHTDELDDILDIIERDRQASERPQDHYQLPDDLNLEIRETAAPPGDLSLNLTADVEPVLQKLTEILINVEKNIARRTEGKATPEDDETTKSSENIDFNYENLRETDIDEKIEINEHLDEALNELNLEEELCVPPGPREAPEALEKPPEADNPPSKSEINARKIEKTPEVTENPEYEDISEESLEVSEILDRSDSQKSSQRSSKSSKIPEKYQIMEKTDDVLRILDEISRKSAKDREPPPGAHPHEVEINVEVFGDISPACLPGVVIEEVEGQKSLESSEKSVEKSVGPVIEEPEDSRKIEEEEESSEAGDTPREVSEIDLDSPRDQNESRLDIEALDDDLLCQNEGEKDPEVEYPGSGISTSEKDIELMIDKLRASLEQPGLAVAELEARVLRIEQLQIELELEKIKKLEAVEEVSLYMREIPNKPPPPYTPPGVVRLASPQISPTLPPAVIPTNVEELTAFTEKATALIYHSKFNEDEIMSLEAPLDILESSKDSNETSRRDRKIYNTFLFDLCKETVAEIYQSEYEKPGPSWTKPCVKTKPAMKIPKNLEELTEYVNKEVATLFGFKTKLQRENMVMRWSRKRRDRVDELLAREAQAEEDEWTKFHHDELDVKNELTIAILDTLVLETTSIVKAAFIKKQKIFV
ncbi:centrosome-associated protein 350 [Diachasma alloeum]|uniref:centrosome-associated protein 350 n=1 Tax=Diachasma alloeum TaxID=454923 RepID=UPI0007381E0B|nr:centrosome-associated protein 350 [Diachasma alloeum]